MKNDDFGFYGKGLDGYVHYRQGMQEAARNAPNASGGRRPPAAPQRTDNHTEEHTTPQAAEPVPIGTWIKRHPLHTTTMIAWFIALTCMLMENMRESSATFLTATAIICAVALILLGMEIIHFIIWFLYSY